MFLDGYPEVFPRLVAKKRMLEMGDPRHTEIRPVLIVCSGVIRGVHAGAQARAMHRYGLTRVFDGAIGISAGEAVKDYFVAGQSKVGTSVFYEECMTPKFMRGTIIPHLNTYHLCGDVMRFGDKALKADLVRSSRTSLRTALTDAETGEGVLADTKAVPEITEAIEAAISIPGRSSRVIEINGRPCIDGWGAYQLPIREAIELYDATDILILGNGPPFPGPDRVGAAALAMITRGFPAPVREQFLSASKRQLSDLMHLRQQRFVRYCAVWTDNSDEQLDLFEKNAFKVRRAADTSFNSFSSLLRQAVATPAPAL